MRPSLRPVAVVVVSLATVLALSACTSETGTTVAVTATDEACEVADTELSAGAYTFEVSNEGSQVTELYIYTAEGKVVGEVENVGPGVTQELQVELEAGKYEAACKPGMTGDGIRTPLTVS